MIKEDKKNTIVLLNRKFYNKDLCPYCGITIASSSNLDFSYRTIYKEYTCDSCGGEWTEVHEVTKVFNRKTDDEDYLNVETHDYGRKKTNKRKYMANMSDVYIKVCIDVNNELIDKLKEQEILNKFEVFTSPYYGYAVAMETNWHTDNESTREIEMFVNSLGSKAGMVQIEEGVSTHFTGQPTQVGLEVAIDVMW